MMWFILIFPFLFASDKCDLEKNICLPVDFSKRRLQTETEEGCFFSPSIKTRVCYSVTFPEGYPFPEPAPSLVFLHGRGANNKQFEGFCNQCSQPPISRPCFGPKGPPGLIISPSQTVHTYWKNSPDGQVLTEDMIKTDLNAHMSAQQARVSTAPRDRGIFGISMGGHGATYMAMKNPQFYGAGMYAISPVFRDEDTLAPDDVRGCGRGADFRRRDPCTLYRNRGTMPMSRFRMEIAPDDPFLASVPNTQNFFNDLKKKYPEEVAVQGSGGHAPAYWCGAIHRAMVFFGDEWRRAKSVPSDLETGPAILSQ